MFHRVLLLLLYKHSKNSGTMEKKGPHAHIPEEKYCISIKIIGNNNIIIMRNEKRPTGISAFPSNFHFYTCLSPYHTLPQRVLFLNSILILLTIDYVIYYAYLTN